MRGGLVSCGRVSKTREVTTVIEYRSFINTDPPHLVEIWRSQPRERALAQPMSVDIFEQHVLSKLYFDAAGLIVAVDGDQPVGFAHAAFGSTEDEQQVSYQWGCTMLVMVRANYQRQGIGRELLSRSEAYLRSRGAKVLYAGGLRPFNGFYLGLYGGSELPGVLESSTFARQLFLSRGYREVDRSQVLHLDLKKFRPCIDRTQLQIKRTTTFKADERPASRNWWDACVFSPYERTRFTLSTRDSEQPVAQAMTWDMTTFAGNWGIHAAGLVEVEVQEGSQRQGYATYLLGEVFKQLQSQGISLVETQTMQRNTAALALYRKLGFKEVDNGAVYRKDGTGDG